ncbi:site-specific integrase, partial [Qipengyuania atrilutea]
MKAAIGKGEVWQSLKTDSLRTARRRAFVALAEIESRFEQLRGHLGMPFDSTLQRPSYDGGGGVPANTSQDGRRTLLGMTLDPSAPVLTFGEVYDRFMSDPTQDWSPRTRLAYQTTQRLAVSIIGADLPINQLSRAVCRDFLETLRYLPKQVSRAFPDLSPKEAASKAKSEGLTNLMSAANINIYLNKLCVVLNWAVREEFLVRNHLKGLRVADPVNQRDKRLPFESWQLESIFSAPLYSGCLNDAEGYARCGDRRPRGTRFWVPLLGLWQGLRLNEACQLDITDVRNLDGVSCLVVTADSLVGSTDKRLKTSSSERIVPLHPFLHDLGFLDFVRRKADAGETKLFDDINPGADGIRSTSFSKWFILFLGHAKAVKPKTSFHSFRHCFRDALRDARVDREVAMVLGGWGSGSKSGFDVSDYYGRGYEPSFLREEIAKINFDRVKALARLS